MTRHLIAILATMAIAFIAATWFPWWTLAPAAAIVAVLSGQRPIPSLLVAGIAGLLLWGGLAFWYDVRNDHILSSQIGQLFKGLKPMQLVLLSAVVGGLTSALGGLTGALLTPLLRRR